MNLQTRLLLSTACILILLGSLHLLLSYRSYNALRDAELLHEAKQIQALIMSTRRVYHQQFLASGLPVNDATVGFLPAHALARISADFSSRENSCGLSFNNVSDRPRNPNNAADIFEHEALAWFRNHPEAEERITTINGYYHYASPIWIEPYCLQCHGVQEIAPASIVERYDAGYAYQEGDLRGLISIKIPTAALSTRLGSIWQQQLLLYVLGYGLTFLALAALIRQHVTQRLAQLEHSAQRLTQGDYSQRVPIEGEDEISTLAVSFNRMAQAIQQRDADIRRFAEVTAHHLQEPARRLVNYSERLHEQLQGQVNNPESLLSLQFIQEQASRQRQLLHDVELYLAADQPRGPIRPIHTTELVQQILRDQAAALQEAGIVVTCTDLPALTLDAPRAADLFSLLLDNALCHGWQQGQQTQVHIQGVLEGPWLHYSITDTGPGIDILYRERVFRVFERLNSCHRGTGIGLAIVRHIVESVGGKAWIEAGPQGGCSVHFLLPLNPPKSG